MNLVFRLYIGLSVLWILEAVAQRRPPNYSQDKMPVTSFSCRDKILGGYYADPETDCQMFHVCVKVPGLGVQDYKFLCPNNTSFDQENQICDDWYNIDCEASTLYYSDNFDLYRIGSDVGGERVKDVARLPNININNAVSDHDDDYLQKSDRGENVGSDILRGSQSGNFFSNKNRGKEDDFEETKKKKTNGKSNVRKLLTGKRPVTSTTTQVYQATSQPRSNFGRNRVASNFNRGTETYSTTPKASYYENTQNYNSQSTTPRTSTLNTNYETQKLYRLNTQSFQQYDEPSNGEFLKTAPSQNLGASNFNRVQNSYKSFNASVSSSYNFISPSTQKATTYQSTPAPFQKQYPTTQNYYTTTQKQQNFNNPKAQQQNYKPSTQNFNSPKVQQQNYQSSTQNYYSTTQKPQNFYNPSTQQQNYQPSTQNFNNPTTQKQQNFNKLKTQQQNYNPSTQNYYSTTQKPQNYYNPSTQQQNYQPNTQTQKQQNFFNPSTQQQNYNPSTQNYYSTTQKPQNFYNPSTQQQNYNPSTQNFNNPTTQKQQNFYNPSTQQQNYQPSTQFKNPTTQNFYNPSTQQQNLNNPTTQNYNQQNYYSTTAKPYPTTQKQQTTRQQFNPTQNFYTTTQKTELAQSVATTPRQKAQNSFFIPNGPTRGSATFAVTDATEKPRPFTNQPLKETKEKEQYDYAYYDDAPHAEYENIDALDFARTKSKKN